MPGIEVAVNEAHPFFSRVIEMRIFNAFVSFAGRDFRVFIQLLL
jgi:hypothetical protein